MPAAKKTAAPAAPKAEARKSEAAAIPALHLEFEEFIDRLGLRYFKGSELTEYWRRTRDTQRGKIMNECPPEVLWPHIVPTLLVLDRIREEAGIPITLNSTYRCPRYNAAVGGEPNSFHMRFMAIDFSAGCGARELHRIATAMRGGLFKLPGNGGNFRFAGGIGLYVSSDFVHIDTRGTNADWKSK